MAMPLPPPLPNRVPPPLPSRSSGGLPVGILHRVPALPTSGNGPRSGIADPFATPAQLADQGDRGNFSTRDVERAGGNVFGVWVAVTSQAIDRIRFDYDWDLATGKRLNTGTITIEYISLALYEFPNRSPADFMDLFESSSKGRFNYYEIRGPGPSQPGKSRWQFRKLRGPSRSSAEIRRIQGVRAPVGERQQRRTYTVGGKRQAYGKGGRRRAGGGTPSVH